MKHSKFIFSILFFIAFGLKGFGQTLNIPQNHSTMGTLVPPVVLDPNDPPSTIHFSIVNNTNCSLHFNFWFTINGVDKKFSFDLLPNGIEAITSYEILQLFPSGSIQYIMYSSFDVRNSGNENATEIGEGYPDMNTDVSNSDISEGCNCIHINWNKSTNTIVIDNC